MCTCGDRQTDTQTRVTNTYFASATTHAKCNDTLNLSSSSRARSSWISFSMSEGRRTEYDEPFASLCADMQFAWPEFASHAPTAYMSVLMHFYDQFTPPTQRNWRVSLRRRCELNLQRRKIWKLNIAFFNSASSNIEMCTQLKTKTNVKLIPERRAMPNVMADLSTIGGALCSTPQSLADAHY